MSQHNLGIKQPVSRTLQCPAFDCKNNNGFICAARKTRDEHLSELSIQGPVSPKCLIEKRTVLSTRQDFTLAKNGNYHLFLSYVPGQGLFTGLFEGRGVELYAVRYNSGQLSKVDFYYDKGLKWIPKDQLLLPGFEIKDRISIDG